ncbi:Pao retrotransposon peptidase family protein, partial [Aphelenchoides avenae]
MAVNPEMYGKHVTRSVRGFQRTYEERTFEYRRHIEFLIRERKLYQDKFQDLQPTFADDEQRLSHLDATIRKNISELQERTIDYVGARKKWEQLVDDYQIIDYRHTNEWARSISSSSSATTEIFPEQFTNKELAWTQFVVQASNEKRAPPAKIHLLSNIQQQRSVTTRTSHPLLPSWRERLELLRSSKPCLSSWQVPVTAQLRHVLILPSWRETFVPYLLRLLQAHTNRQVTINEDATRHYYSDRSSATYLQSPAAHHLPAPHRDVPIVDHLEFDNNSTLSVSPSQQDNVYRYSPHDWDGYDGQGVMTYSDGNVAAASPMAWHSPQISSPALFSTHGQPGMDVPLTFRPRISPAHLTAAGATDQPTTRPTRVAPPPPSRLAAPTTNHLMSTTTTSTTTTLAGGRGPSSSLFLGPTTVDTSGRLPSATFSRGPLGPSASAATVEAHAEEESASAFYRNATFHRDTKTTPLVLKELPITPFNGNIRQYPMFRNRFLDVVEGHANLPPRHKLQYLLQFLQGEPLQLANNFQLTDENYYAVVNLLEERYGNQDMIRNLLMGDLIALRPPADGASDLRRFHGEAFRVTTDLKQLGDDVDSNRLYEQTLMSKLSPALKMELIRNSDYVKEKTASSILAGLNNYIQLLETTANTGVLFSKMSMGNSCPPGGRTPPRPSSPRYPSNAHHAPRSGYAAEAEAVHAADPQPERKICAFCGLTHWSAQCHVYYSITKRYHRAKKLGY